LRCINETIKKFSAAWATNEALDRAEKYTQLIYAVLRLFMSVSYLPNEPEKSPRKGPTTEQTKSEMGYAVWGRQTSNYIH